MKREPRPGCVRWLLWPLAVLLAGVFPINRLAAEDLDFVVEGAVRRLSEVTPGAPPYLRAMRFNSVRRLWNVDLAVTNQTGAALSGPIVVLVEAQRGTSGVLESDGVVPGANQRPYWVVWGSPLGSGAGTLPRTVSLGDSGVSPELTLRVFAAVDAEPRPLALVRTLDAIGQPLTAVRVTEVTADATNSLATDVRFGMATLGGKSGRHVWEFQRDGFLPVWRWLELSGAGVRVIPNPRLTARNVDSVVIPAAGGVISNGPAAIAIRFPVGAFASPATAVLTPLTAQTLPAMLPRGWSPLQAFWIELNQGLGAAMELRLRAWDSVTAGEGAVLARWNAGRVEWEAVSIQAGKAGAAFEFALNSAGAYALVVGDRGAAALPPAVVGEGLRGIDGLAEAGELVGLAGQGAVVPGSSPASRNAVLVTADATLRLSHSAALPSGLVVRGEVSERYEMLDGSVRVTPRYDEFLVGYQRPGEGVANLLSSRFPMRPLLLLGSDELARASVDIDVTAPGAFRGAVFDASGGAVASGDVEVRVGRSMLARPMAVELRELDVEDFISLTPTNQPVVAAFQLNAGDVAPGRGWSLRLNRPDLPPTTLLVLARLIARGGFYALEPLERLRIGTDGLVSLEPSSGERLVGLNGAGQFVLLRVPELYGVVTGVAKGLDGGPMPDAPVRVHGQPWLTFSDADGRYRLLAPTGSADVTLLDGITDEEAGHNSTVVMDPLQAVVVDVSTSVLGPRVAEVSPAANATGVAVGSPIAITFSKAVNPATVLGDAFRLEGAAGQPVAVAVSLNLRGTVVTLLPQNPLTTRTQHRLLLSSTIADTSGRRLDGPWEFAFTTAGDDTLRDAAAQLISHEPLNGVMRLEGTQGFAEPRQPVLLVNETTGRTTTVLANDEGGFIGELEASLTDELDAVTVNANGTRNQVPVNRQVFRDGSVALFDAGGTIEVPGENGPIQVLVEPGSLNGRTKFRIESVPLAQVMNVVSNTQPLGGRVLGGFKWSAIEGNPLKESVDIVFPVKLDDMQLPAGVSPTDCTFGLAIARIIDDVPVFELVDRMHFEDGKLVTHSPPFFGLLGLFEDVFAVPLLMAVNQLDLIVHGKVYAAEVDTGTGRPVRGTEQPLSGAIVRGHPANSSIQARGALRPGSVFTTSGRDGKYTILVPTAAGNFEQVIGITARHPKYPGVFPASGLPALDAGTRLAIGNVLTPHDIVFPLRAAGQKAPPVLAISHNPLQVQPREDIHLTVVATDNDSVPTVSIYLESFVSLTPGVTVNRGDVSLEEIERADVGPHGIRRVYAISCKKPANLLLRVRALDGDFLERVQNYVLRVGGSEPPIDNPIPVADPHDNTGPFVVSTQPSRDAGAHPLSEPIVLQFDEPLDRRFLLDPTAILMTPPATLTRKQLSADQSALTLQFLDLQPATQYTLALGTYIRDLAGNTIDQDPILPGQQAFSMSFRTAPLAVGAFPDVDAERGVGALVKGNFAFVLERGRPATSYGRLSVFDLTLPTAPVRVTEIRTQPYPRDFVFIPHYSFAYTNGLSSLPTTLAEITNVMTRDLIAVVGGTLGQGQVQSLRLIDVTDPRNPTYLAAAIVANSGFEAVTRVRWSAPMLSYLEVAQPDRVNTINLQEFIIGQLLLFNQKEYKKLDDFAFPGVDANHDGDFVDPGDQLPRPARHPVDFAGKVDTFVTGDTEQAILDIGMEDGGDFIGALLSAGYKLDERNRRADPIPASYRTLYAAGLELNYTNANFALPPGIPKSLTTLFSFPLLRSNVVDRLDLALASVQGFESDPDNHLVVIDVTDRTAPKALTEIRLPRAGGNTNVWGFGRREDGLLMVASDTNAFLIDPARLAMPRTQGGPHPALLGVVPGAGGMTRNFESTLGGLNVSPRVSEVGAVSQTAPLISFVNFGTNQPFAPTAVIALGETNVDRYLSQSFEVTSLLPSRFREETNVVQSAIRRLAPQTHYYVLVHAPGGAGAEIDLALESLNWAGYPSSKRGLLFPPVHSFSPAALADLGQSPGPDDAPVRTLRAWRLSNDPASRFYNVYLSRPVVVVYEDLSQADLAEIDQQLERNVLWGGFQVRATLDPSMRTNAVLGPFAGRVDLTDRTYKPGVEAVAYAWHADYIQSPNPGPVSGGQAIPMALNAITPHNSELVINATDLALPGRRLTIDFRRNYSGQSLYDGPFGRGWDFNFNQRVVELTPELMPEGLLLPQVVRRDSASSEIAETRDLVFHTGGGRAIVYKFAGTNPPPEVANDPLVKELRWHTNAVRFYLPPPGVFAPMFKFRDGRFARLDTDGKQTWFNARGRLAKIYDRYEKNSLEAVYNRRGDLVRIYDELRRPIDIGYYRVSADPEFRPGVDEISSGLVGLGRIARLKDYSNRDVLYFYTPDGLLERREGPLIETAAAGGFTGRQVTHYQYSGADEPGRSAKSLVALTGQDPGGAPVLAVSALGAQGRDTVNALKAGGVPMTLTQLHPNTARAMAEPLAGTSIGTADGAVADYRFDGEGRVTEIVTRGPRAGAMTNRTEYWPNGLLKAVIAPEGNRTEYYYDSASPSLRSRGNLVRVVRNPGPRGGAVLEAHGHFDPWYNLPVDERTDYSGNTGFISLFPDHRDIAAITQAGVTETFTVNEFGQKETHTTPDGLVEETLYNADGFPSFRKLGEFQTRLSYAPRTGAISDPGMRGRPSQVIDPRGIPTDYVYDELDQLVSTTRAGAGMTHAYDSAGNLLRKTVDIEAGRTLVQTNGYNRLGFLTATALLDIETAGGATNLVTTYEPDELNRIRSVVFPNGEKHVFAYDHAGRISSHEVVGSHLQQFEYDSNGNLIKTRIGDATEVYTYDGHDRMIRQTGANGVRTELVLDGLGNVVTNTVVDAANRVLKQTTFEYDALNRPRMVTRLRDNGVSVTRTDYNAGARAVTVTDALGASATTTFDGAGRPLRYDGPNQAQEFGYDPNGNLHETRVTEGGVTYVETREFNDRDQLVSLKDNAGNATTMEVGLDGRVLRSTDREGQVTTNRYSALGELLAQTSPNGVMRQIDYASGRQVISIADVSGHRTRYEFDAQGRLRAQVQPDLKTSTFGDFDPFNQPRTNALPRGIEVVNAYDLEGQVTNRVVRSAGGTRREDYEFDGLRRIQRITDPSGSVEFTYDIAGFIKETRHNYVFTTPPVASSLPFSVAQETDAADFRTALVYPQDGFRLSYGRDGTGRLESMTPAVGEPVIQGSTWVGDARLGSRVLGRDRIRMELAYDGSRRVAGRRYTAVAGGHVLVDHRHSYDRNGALVGRQFLERGGRADFFRHDSGYRLVRADIGARPLIAGEALRALAGFNVPAQFEPGWAPGLYARAAEYRPVDLVSQVNLVNPDGLALAPMVSGFGAPDALLFVSETDGFTRERDEVGNVTRTRLAVRIPGAVQPEWVEATLTYNDLGQLTKIERADGVKVEAEYDSFGLRIRRRVSGPANRCERSDVAFLYDGAKLIEERDLADGMRLVRRYYYADEADELVGGDLQVGGELARHYFLSDSLRSVVAVANAAGEVVERVSYDPWGAPLIEGADHLAPAVSSIVREAGGLRIAFSEPILPAASDLPPGTNWLTAFPSLDGAVTLIVNGAERPSRLEWVEQGSSPGGFGSVIRLIPNAPVSGPATLRIEANRFRDSWNNRNQELSTTLDMSAAAGATLVTGAAPGSTQAPVLVRSAVGSSFLFQGQVFDYETGLVYCRARYYDPTTGMFLSRDPAGYADSVNLYAGFKNNPVTYRDITGSSIDETGRELEAMGNQFTYKDSSLMDYMFGRATAFVGRTMQLGTKAAEGWELMESNRPGTLGLMDRLQGAELFIGDVQQAFASGGAALSAVGAVSAIRGVAGRAAGYFEHIAERRRNNRANRTFLHEQGLAGFEIEGFLNGIERFKREIKADTVEVAIRSFKKEKRAARREAVENRYLQKPTRFSDKTNREGLLTDYIVERDNAGKRHVREVTVTGDTDLFYVQANGRTLNEAEVQRFRTIVNQEQAKAYRRRGGTEVPNVGVLHGAHVNLPELWGTKIHGKTVDASYLKKVGSPGAEAFAIRSGAHGHVTTFEPGAGSLRDMLMETRQKFWNTRGLQLPENWFDGFSEGVVKE